MSKRRRIRGSSTLRDVQAQGPNSDQPNIYEPDQNLTPPGTTGSSQVLPGALYGQHYAEVRNVIEIPFDDSLDSSFPLECFFVMPTGTTKVNSAKAYVQQKPFRMYSSAAATGTGSTTSGSSSATTTTTDAGGATPSSSGGDLGHTHDAHSAHDTQGAHAHASHAHDFNHASTEDNSYASHDHATGVNSFVDSPHSHTGHSAHQHDSLGGHSHTGHTTHNTYQHDHTIGHSHSHSHGMDHTHSVSNSHSHTLTPGIFESGPSGTFSVAVSDDGTTYGAALTSGVTSADGLDLTGLTSTAGAKRIKLTATGLQRVQVLVVLDLLVQVVLPS